jgi:hypothetical protein
LNLDRDTRPQENRVPFRLAKFRVLGGSLHCRLVVLKWPKMDKKGKKAATSDLRVAALTGCNT